jgi:hypothetical protein
MIAGIQESLESSCLEDFPVSRYSGDAQRTQAETGYSTVPGYSAL